MSIVQFKDQLKMKNIVQSKVQLKVKNIVLSKVQLKMKNIVQFKVQLKMKNKFFIPSFVIEKIGFFLFQKTEKINRIIENNEKYTKNSFVLILNVRRSLKKNCKP